MNISLALARVWETGTVFKTVSVFLFLTTFLNLCRFGLVSVVTLAFSL